MKRVIVLGAGPLGLSFTKEILDLNTHVVLIDASEVGGGLAQPQTFDGMNIDRFYHFFYWKDDAESINFLNETKAPYSIVWKNIESSTYHDGSFYNFDSILEVLRLAGRNIFSVLFTLLKLKILTIPKKLDGVSAADWAVSSFGEKFASSVWLPLLRDKFGEKCRSVSAYWLATRIKRHLSTKVGFPPKCRFGYLEQTYKGAFEKIIDQVKMNRGNIVLKEQVIDIVVENNRATKLVFKSGKELQIEQNDTLVSTIPLASLKFAFQKLPFNMNYLEKFEAVAVLVVTLSITRVLSNQYWTTVSDSQIPFNVIIQQNRLFPKGDQELVYLSKYFYSIDNIFSESDESVFNVFFAGLQKMYPDLKSEDIRTYSISRSRAGAPIPTVGSLNSLPEFRAPIENFYHAGYEHIYPEDRGVGNSFKVGRELAATVKNHLR